jgi:hypothetical protein
MVSRTFDVIDAMINWMSYFYASGEFWTSLETSMLLCLSRFEQGV